MVNEITRALKNIYLYLRELFPVSSRLGLVLVFGLSLASFFFKETPQDVIFSVLFAVWVFLVRRAVRKFERTVALCLLLLVLAFVAESFNFKVAQNLGVLAFIFLLAACLFKLWQLRKERE